MLVGFSSERPQDIDLPVAMNGIPVPIRNAYTSPHVELRKWQGTTKNLLVGKSIPPKVIHEVMLKSPYGFDLAAVTPLFNDEALGSQSKR